MIWDRPIGGYFISAVFIDLTEVTHYMVHTHNDPGVTGAVKMSKEDVITLVEKSGFPVHVWEWSYTAGRFLIGKQVNCNIDYHKNKYLWVNEKDPKTKNLKHLPRLDWYQSIIKKD